MNKLDKIVSLCEELQVSFMLDESGHIQMITDSSEGLPSAHKLVEIDQLVKDLSEAQKRRLLELL